MVNLIVFQKENEICCPKINVCVQESEGNEYEIDNFEHEKYGGGGSSKIHFRASPPLTSSEVLQHISLWVEPDLHISRKDRKYTFANTFL